MIPSKDEALSGVVLDRPASDEERQGLTLHSDCLVSRWGFNDGDMPEWIEDACDEHGVDFADHLRHDVWHDTLWTLVNDHLLPALDQRVELVRIHTTHNPVRACTVDGVSVEDQWTEVDTTVELTPESVTVPLDAVLATVRAAVIPAAPR